jgi:hypothetical protein
MQRLLVHRFVEFRFTFLTFSSLPLMSHLFIWKVIVDYFMTVLTPFPWFCYSPFGCFAYSVGEEVMAAATVAAVASPSVVASIPSGLYVDAISLISQPH